MSHTVYHPLGADFSLADDVLRLRRLKKKVSVHHTNFFLPLWLESREYALRAKDLLLQKTQG